MSESLAIQHPRVLAALSAGDMALTQQQLTGWCQKKLQALALEYREQRENMLVAKRAKWKHSAWESAMRTTKRKIVYYAKMWAAVKAGFLIVPNFDAEVMAVRVVRQNPRHESSYHPSNLRAKPDKAAVGVGTYVDDTTAARYTGYVDRSNPDQTKHRTVDRYTTDGFAAEIDFPIAVVKPQVMTQTQRAMGLRIFDSIAVAGAPRKDPMVLGRILGDNGKVVTFFIAWWLDLETL